MTTFEGYRRSKGLPGIRNGVAVIPSVFCANTVARRIAEHVAGAIAFCHPVGCSQVGLDLELTARGLKGLGRHPNFYGVVVVGLGCERFRARELAESIAAAGKPVEMLVIQEEGDSLRAIEKGVTFASRLVEEASRQRREAFPLSDFSLGLKCGGTDATSGLAANPALGWVTDRIVAAGGDRADRGGEDPRRAGSDAGDGPRHSRDDRQHGKKAKPGNCGGGRSAPFGPDLARE
jgi:altronate dehydratase large subunit